MIDAANSVPVYNQQYACQRSRAHADAMRTMHQSRVSAHKGRSKYQIGLGREIELTTMVGMGSLSVSKQVDAEMFEDTVHDETVSDRIRSIVGILSSNPNYLASAYKASGAVYQDQSNLYSDQFNGALSSLGDSAGTYIENRKRAGSAEDSFGVLQSDAGPTKAAPKAPQLLRQSSAGRVPGELAIERVIEENI